MTYRPEIDGLRALAVLPVILFHAGFSFFEGGYIGVDIFFVISGYLISSLIFFELSQDKFSLLNFYERRARRILPALFFVIIVSIPFSLLILTPDDLKDYFQSIFATSIFSSNFLFWMESGYFETDSELKPFLHTWSLAVEEQYYILFPLLALMLSRKDKIFNILIISFLFLISFLSLIILRDTYPSGSFYLLPFRAWEILLGVFGYFYFSYSKKIHSTLINNILSLIGFGMICYSIVFFSKETPFPSLYTLIPTFGCIFIIISAVDGTILNKLLKTSFLVKIGLVSYSAYLWHHPIFAFTRLSSLNFMFEALVPILILLTFLLAFFSFHYIESPFRKGKSGSIFSRKMIFTQSLLLTSLLSFVGIMGHFQHTKIFFDDQEWKYLTSIKRSSYDLCGDSKNFCIDRSLSSEDVLLIGDSNAYHFADSLKEILEIKNLNLINLSNGGCLPLSDFIRLDETGAFNKSCSLFNKNLEYSLEKSEFKGDIVLSSAWLLYLFGEDYFSSEVIKKRLPPLSDVILSSDSFTPIKREIIEKEFFDYIRKTIEFLSKNSKKLFIVGPIPPMTINYNLKSDLKERNIKISYSTYKKFSDQLNSLFNSLAKKDDIYYIQPDKSLCSEEFCNGSDAKGHFYSDSTHFSKYGQNKIMKKMFDDIF
tara:strand:- start:4436 stop:6394 length:1959 start_codon:yes stop_codon:yes gene_type:complete